MGNNLHFKLTDFPPATRIKLLRQLNGGKTPNIGDVIDGYAVTAVDVKETKQGDFFKREEKTVTVSGTCVDPSKTPRKHPPRPSVPDAPPPGVNLYPYRQTKRATPSTRAIRGAEFDSANEKEYFTDVLHGIGRVHPVTFRLADGQKYTPDFLTVDDGVLTFHEVKGAYRLHSADGAQSRFKQAVYEYGAYFNFLWVERKRGGGWTIKQAFYKED